MSNELSIRIPGVPVAQPRQRHRVVKIGNHVRAQNYTPTQDPVNAFKAACKFAIAEAYKAHRSTDRFAWM